MIPIVILASGRGSNFEAIRKAIQNEELDVEIRGVISDQPKALVLERAKEWDIPAVAIPFPSKNSGAKDTELSLEERRRKHEGFLLEQLSLWKPRFLVMAGYFRIITPLLIEAFRSERSYSRILNIHPSLLPAFPGLNSYAQAFHAGVKVAGVSVHLVEAGVDSGPICAQQSFSIADCQSEWEVEQRGLAVEHRLYPETLRWVLKEEFKLEERSQGRLCVCPN